MMRTGTLSAYGRRMPAVPTLARPIEFLNNFAATDQEKERERDRWEQLWQCPPL